MNQNLQGAGLRRRLLGLGTAAMVAVSLVAVGPAAAQAAPKPSFKQSISGTVKFSTDKKAKAGSKHGYLAVYKNNCQPVNWDDFRVSWKGNKYTVKFAKAGTYRISYSQDGATNSSPFGFSTGYAGSAGNECKQAKGVKVGTGKRVTNKNISVQSSGRVEVTGVKLKKPSRTKVEAIALYNAKTGKHAAILWSHDSKSIVAADVPAGRYTIAKVSLQTGGGRDADGKATGAAGAPKVLQVLGAKGKNAKKGKQFSVKAGKGISVSWKSGKATSKKAFSAKASVKLNRGKTLQVGQTVKASVKGFPKGTKLSYQWSNGKGKIKNAKKSSYKPKSSDAASSLYLTVTAKRSGYFTSTVWAYKYVVGQKLKQKSPQRVNGKTASYIEIEQGQKLTVTKAAFNASTKVTYSWFDSEGGYGTGSSFQPTAGATYVSLYTTYTRTGYEPVTKSVAISLVAPVEEAPPADSIEPQEEPVAEQPENPAEEGSEEPSATDSEAEQPVEEAPVDGAPEADPNAESGTGEGAEAPAAQVEAPAQG